MNCMPRLMFPPRLNMRLALVCVLPLAVWGSACWAMAQNVSQASVADGEALYAKLCALCHGEHGEGGRSGVGCSRLSA